LRIESVRVLNYRSIYDETLACSGLTVLIGANGAGKSTFLRALDLFYAPQPRVAIDDFYAADASKEIVVSVMFSQLPAVLADAAKEYVVGGELVIERVITVTERGASARYHGSVLRHPRFDSVRAGLQVKDRGVTARAAYEQLAKEPAYSSLPAWSTLAGAASALTQWEAGHPETCDRARDDGHFFAFQLGALCDLRPFTRFLYIPAVRDAGEDAEEGRGSVLTALMELLVRSEVAKRPAFVKAKEQSQSQYEAALAPSLKGELGNLGKRLTLTLDGLVKGAIVSLTWQPLPEIELPMPEADVRLVEDGYPTSVDRTGHGLQRAYIMTMLQHLAIAQAANELLEEGESGGSVEQGAPTLVLAIEEPELYQHPSRQRHFSRTLRALAGGAGKGVAAQTQVIYGTHSPLLVSVDNIEELRLLRRVAGQAGKPKITKIIRTTLDEVASELWALDGKPEPPYNAQTLIPRLRAVMSTQMSEGFFADAVVLVEGEDDRAALLGTAQALNEDFESAGCAVIACGGKNSLDRPHIIFSRLGIPVYLVWDSDKGNADPKEADKNKKVNRRLLRLVKAQEQDWPSVVGDKYAVLEGNLDTTLRSDLGAAVYDGALGACCDEFHMTSKQARKNPFIVAEIVRRAHKAGSKSQTLETIVKKIVALRG
jgi:energy-coupling factor transporter ATP-binding protein EcfA2